MMTGRLWPRLGSPRSWRRSTRRLFLLLSPVTLPLWVVALIVRSVLDMIRDGLFVIAKFWNDPPRQRVRYHIVDHPDEPGAEAENLVRLRIKRSDTRRRHDMPLSPQTFFQAPPEAHIPPTGHPRDVALSHSGTATRG
jgi:hypothetical protein